MTVAAESRLVPLQKPSCHYHHGKTPIGSLHQPASFLHPTRKNSSGRCGRRVKWEGPASGSLHRLNKNAGLLMKIKCLAVDCSIFAKPSNAPPRPRSVAQRRAGQRAATDTSYTYTHRGVKAPDLGQTKITSKKKQILSHSFSKTHF